MNIQVDNEKQSTKRWKQKLIKNIELLAVFELCPKRIDGPDYILRSFCRTADILQ